MSEPKKRVLILDGMWNKTLAAVRSFGEKDFYVAVGETTRFSTALFSRYAKRKIVYPSPCSKPVEFMEWLMDELEGSNYDMLLPTELSTQLLLAKNRKEITKHTGFPFPDYTLVRKVHDKAWLMRYASSKGYPVPATCFTTEEDGGDGIGDVEGLMEALSFPVVIKPTNSSGSRGQEYVFNKEDFKEALLRVHDKYPYPIIQEYIPSMPNGTGGYGVGALFNYNSEPRAAFVYRRLREYPVTGGPSTMREGVHDVKLKEMALALLKELKWVGPAMVEFKMDPRDQTPKILEINPRLWGSLNLAILSGMDFPYLLWKLAVEGDVEPVMSYKAGLKCRWLIPGDILHLLTSRRLKTLRDVFKKSDGDDLLSLTDPMPVLGRCSSALTFVFDPDMRKLLFR
ncbi:MAG: ATP-grasp domain-containing protein [Thermodesulfobacteriota bacterium]